MSRDVSGGAVLGFGMLVVVLGALVAPPKPAGRDIWVVTASEEVSSRPALVRAAHPNNRRVQVASAQ
jgi:hypothetical protein